MKCVNKINMRFSFFAGRRSRQKQEGPLGPLQHVSSEETPDFMQRFLFCAGVVRV